MDYQHCITHPASCKIDTKPSPEALEYIKCNINIGPSELFHSLVGCGLIGGFLIPSILFNLHVLIIIFKQDS